MYKKGDKGDKGEWGDKEDGDWGDKEDGDWGDKEDYDDKEGWSSFMRITDSFIKNVAM